MKTTGLTLAEAVKSGRPFKLKYENHWIGLGANKWGVTIEAALSSEWEIQPPPPKQTWTREEVEELMGNIRENAVAIHHQDKFDSIIKKGGL